MTNATRERVELPIEGMSCASCAARIERTLNRLDGVSASVNYATEQALVEFDPAAVTPAALVEAIEDVGYSARLPAAEPAPDEPDPTADLRRRLIVASVLSPPVLLLAMIPAFQFTYWQWLALELATPVVLWAGWPFHLAAWKNLRHGLATMDTLISVGTLAAWGWSVVALFFLDAGVTGVRMPFRLLPGHSSATDQLYLEVAAVVILFQLAGRYFEARAKRRAGAALRALAGLGAKEAAILDDDGTERLTPIEPARARAALRRPPRREDRHGRHRPGGAQCGRRVAAHGRERAGRGGRGRSCRRRHDQRRRPPRGQGRAGRGRHRAGPGREARQRGAVGQGAGAAPRRPRLCGLRAVRARPFARDLRLLVDRPVRAGRSRSQPPSPS